MTVEPDRRTEAGTQAGVAIRPCAAGDIDAIEAAIPSPGTSRFHAQRFDEQQAGRSTYLIAWDGPVPVGHLNLRWPGPAIPAVARVLRRCPEINALGVSPEERRSQGIGTALVTEAERRATERGSRRICLAVAIDNTDAARLYERLGYRDWGRGTVISSWSYRDDVGQPVVEREVVRYLLKGLTGPE